MRGTLGLAALAAALAVAGCSRPETPAAAPTPAPRPAAAAPAVVPASMLAPAAAAPQPFANLGVFVGKPPLDLMQHAGVAAELRRVVPQHLFKCLDSSFDGMRDLERQPLGALGAQLNGSHADQFMEGYLNVEPSGWIDVVLQCDAQGQPKGEYQYFTNRAADAAVPGPLLDWLHVVGAPGDRVVRSTPGSAARSAEFQAFLAAARGTAAPAATIVAAAAPPAPAPAPATAQVAPAPAVATPVAASNNGAAAAANREIVKASAQVLLLASLTNKGKIPEIDGVVRACNTAYERVPADLRGSDDPAVLRPVAGTCLAAATGVCTTFRLYDSVQQCGALRALPAVQ